MRAMRNGMSKVNITFKELVDFYRHPSFVFDKINANVAYFTPKNDADIEIVTNLLSEGYETGLGVQEGDTIKKNNRITFIQILPRIGFGRLLEDFPDLLKKFPLVEPKNYYVKSLDFYNKDENPHENINKYRKILGFIDFLKKTSAYYDESTRKIIFVTEGMAYKIDVQGFQLTPEDMQRIDFFALDRIIEMLVVDDTYRENRKKIFVETIGSFITENGEKISGMNFILFNLTDISQEFEKRFNVFLSNFSYDKIINQLKTMQVEETGKIHKVFSDIQNQALALPIASLLAISQMKRHSDGSEVTLITNSFIIAGVLLFIMIVWFLLKNQKLTLDTISKELISREKRIKHDPKYAVLHDDKEITSIFDDLRKRKSIQKWALRFIFAISLVCFIVSFAYYFYLNFPETWDSILNCYQAIFHKEAAQEIEPILNTK